MTRRFTPTLFIILCNLTAFAAVLLFHLAADTPIHLLTMAGISLHALLKWRGGYAGRA